MESKLKRFINVEASEKKLAIFLILPTAIAVFGILVYPLVYSFILSFTDASLIVSDLNFVGFKNYLKAFQDPALRYSFLITIEYVVMTVFTKLLLGIAISLAVKEKFIGRGLVRATMIIPWAVPFVVSGTIWRWMLNPNVGVINVILKKIGIIDTNIGWLSNRFFALPSVVLADVWQGTPFFIIIILAGLQTIPEGLYEAAVVDGAGSLRKFIHITLPMIKFPIFIVTILGTVFALNQFDLFYIMTRGGPANYTRVATLYDWQTVFKSFNTSYASAISYLILGLTIVITIIYTRILAKGEK